jgi:hypothetical protein
LLEKSNFCCLISHVCYIFAGKTKLLMFWGGRQGTHLYLTGSQEELELRFVEDDDDTGEPWAPVKLKESPAGGLKSELGIMQ